MLDILCIGDAKIDIFLQIPVNDPHFSLDEVKNNLQISYGRKVSVEKYIKAMGGNAANAAVGISRLGKQVGVCVEIGNDEFSNFIINSLHQENINTSLSLLDLNRQTSFSVIINYKGDRTLLSEDVVREHNFNFETTSAGLIYLTSLGNIWEKTYKKVLSFVKMKKNKLAFNPGTLQIQKRDNLIMELISFTDYLFLNKEEAEIILYGRDLDLTGDQKDIKKLLFGLKALGVKNVIITDAENGSYLQDESGKSFHLGSIKAENTADKTGAGDAYNAGFLSAVIEGKDLQNAMVWGAINSSSVVEKIGSETGLLSREAMEEKLNNSSIIKVEAI